MNNMGFDFTPPKMTPKNKNRLKIGIFIVVILACLLFISSMFYTVGETEQAVILTFGKFTKIAETGLNFKLPWPIQEAKFVPVKLTHKLELGYRSDNNRSVPEESKMITGDMNIINIDFFLEWKIDDPVKYLFNSDEPQLILRNAAQACARSVVSNQNVDDVLTTGKTFIQVSMIENLNISLAHYDIGIRVTDVKIQDSNPPNEEVIVAFKNVETAKQEKATYINQATEYKNRMIPQANSEADKIIREAESQKAGRINQAKGEVALFEEIYSEYVKNKDVTRLRLQLEMLESVMPGMKIYIDGGTGVQTLLPLESFNAGG